MNLRSAASACDKIHAYVEDLKLSDTNFYKSSRSLMLQMITSLNDTSVILADLLSQDSDHMDTGSEIVLNDAKEIETYLDNIISGYKHTYRSSVDNLVELHHCCRRICEKLSMLTGEVEDSTNIHADILWIRTMLEQLVQQSLSVDSDLKPVNISAVKPESREPDMNFKQSKKHSMKFYRDVFDDIRDYDCSMYVVDICTTLICDWFSSRFSGKDKGFHYDISNIPKYILAIVIGFGKSMSTDSISTFVREFQDWLQDVRSQGSRYALPYDIYCIISQPDSEDVTMQGLILWNLLLTSSLEKLTCGPKGLLSINVNDMSNWAKIWNPQILSEYLQNKDNTSILSTYGFLKSYDSESEDE